LLPVEAYGRAANGWGALQHKAENKKSPAAGWSRRGKFMLTSWQNGPKPAKIQERNPEALRFMRSFGQERKAAAGVCSAPVTKEQQTCASPS
jgi:hypothetical protein